LDSVLLTLGVVGSFAPRHATFCYRKKIIVALVPFVVEYQLKVVVIVVVY